MLENWTKISDFRGIIQIVDDQGDLVCALEKHAVNTPGVSAASHARLQESRAALIAAAPQMATALQAAIDAILDLANPNLETDKALEKMQTALQIAGKSALDNPEIAKLQPHLRG